MHERRTRSALTVALAAVVALGACSPSLVTRTRTDPVYEMHRVEVAHTGSEAGRRAPVYEWRRVQVDVVKRDYQEVNSNTATRAFVGAAAAVVLLLAVAWGALRCDQCAH